MQFDVVVIGGGHAGIEAACAAARRGARVAIVTLDADNIGQLSCNPSIGGVGKGHLVRELDVFDGLMARAGDSAAIHRRMLNRSKGPAVHGPRIQADRQLFAHALRSLVATQDVEVLVGEATELQVYGDCIAGVEISGASIACRAVVVATGTFLDARMFCGRSVVAGGRAGETASVPLASQIRELGLAQGRLKTGTPPRIDGRTIDWACCQPQPSDRDAWTLSPMSPVDAVAKLDCSITRTTEPTHEIIRAHFDQSPLFSGDISGRGPRYCPSIEDKVRRFSDRDSHQIFLEPEGLRTPLVYPNGISTSMPEDVQQKFVNSIPGLERATIARPGYAVEYEFADPRRLSDRLEHRDVRGLFLAGQINGTTGYEEAAAQGLCAGINAAAVANGLAPYAFDRRTSYIGVMIDDLTLQGVTEPYRMMTARSEYRLHLRADNAVARLGEDAMSLGGISDERKAQIDRHLACRSFPDFAESEEGKADALYAPYVERQRREWRSIQADEAVRIPSGIAFGDIPGISAEAAERLTASGPSNLGQASRIEGITPSALAALHLALARRAA